MAIDLYLRLPMALVILPCWKRTSEPLSAETEQPGPKPKFLRETFSLVCVKVKLLKI
jgi:hypothetical protein